jgi:hypothetical protein
VRWPSLSVWFDGSKETHAGLGQLTIMQQRNVLPIGLLGALSTLISCKSIHEMQGTLQDVQRVQHGLVRQLGSIEIRVLLSNHRFLNISVVNSPWKSLPAIEKNAKALEIARLAYNSYRSRSDLDRVSVTFAVHRSYLGVFTYDNSTDSFSFETRELAAATSSP